MQAFRFGLTLNCKLILRFIEPVCLRFYVLFKLQLQDAIYRLRFYSNSSTHILSLSNSHNNVASLQKNRGDKSHSVIVALACLEILFNSLSHMVSCAEILCWFFLEGINYSPFDLCVCSEFAGLFLVPLG